ncbi:21231_t:CDS:10 [Dentiscutata erythropus]|uniref:21231_t:CDS:1 n=1 Tax=Dentiscutata erythropus TaxID=1348616 RepID=A0A9N9N334_9GLOM|nr:21231_t:CDS:10 [Dentiscutata erythropus]
MLSQDSVSSLENRKKFDISEETFNDDDSILLNDDITEGLIIDPVGRSRCVKNRQNVLERSVSTKENSNDDIDNSNNINEYELLKSSANDNYDFKSEHIHHNGHVKYQIAGSAPVGNGKWSTLKRKKLNIDLRLGEVSENEILSNSQIETLIVNHNLDENTKNIIPIPLSPLSPRTSLLTAAFSLELQNSSITYTKSENLSLSNINTSPLEKNFANHENSPPTVSSSIKLLVVNNKVNIMQNNDETILDNNQSAHNLLSKTNDKKSEHSNNLQMLFVDTNNKLDSKDVSDKIEDTNQKYSSYIYDNQRKTLLSGNFGLAVKKSWNNEIIESEKILDKHKNEIPRWSVTFAEIQLVKHLMSGQNVNKEVPELTNSLNEAEKLANKVYDNKDDFEATFTTFRTDIWKKDIKPNSTPAEDEAEFASLRANYRWDCELSLADVLLFMSVLQVIGHNEIKGAFNLSRAWKIYSKVRDEIDRIKNSAKKNDNSEPSSASSGKWYFSSSLIGKRGSTASNSGLFGSHKRDSSSGMSDSVNLIEVDPDIEDCLEFSIGVFYFVVSNVPGSFLTMLKAFGFNADRERAIRMIENCYNRDGVRAPFAALFLLVNYLFLTRGLADAAPSLTRAGVIVKECCEKFPYGSSFLFMACQQARKTENIQGAINYITASIKSCENAGITSTIHRFEMGITYLINQDFSAAKDIFELLFYGNTIVFTNNKGSIRLQESLKGSGHFKTRDNGTKKNLLSQFFEFELRPFCGLCLAGCYLLVMSKENSNKEALDVLKQTQAMTNHQVENSSSTACCIGFAGFGVGISKDKKESKNRYNQFAGRHSSKDVKKNSVSPFILFVILYFRRDIVYMPLKLKEKWASLLETIWEKIQKPTDTDTHAIYLLIRGVFEKFLNTPTTAQTTLCECISLETDIVSETWVIPHCRYELGELFYKQLNNREAAMEQFKWILKGPRPISRSGGIIPRNINNINSRKSRYPSDHHNASVYNNPDKFKKYEFSRSLKTRCTVATEQINREVTTAQDPPSPSSFLSTSHVRKKSGSNSSLLKEVQEQSLKRQLKSTPEKVHMFGINIKKGHKPGSSNLAQNNVEDSNDKVTKDKKTTGFKFW